MDIYGLISTREYELCYIGETRQSLAKRLKGHLSGARCGRDTTAKGEWIRQEEADGFEIKIILIARDADSTIEKELISIFSRIKKDALVNSNWNRAFNGPDAAKYAALRAEKQKRFEEFKASFQGASIR